MSYSTQSSARRVLRKLDSVFHNPDLCRKFIQEADGRFEVDLEAARHWVVSCKSIEITEEGVTRTLVPEVPTVEEEHGEEAATKRLVKAPSTCKNPGKRAKEIVLSLPGASRKEVIAAGVAAGVTYNTIDSYHYEMIVKPAKLAKELGGRG